MTEQELRKKRVADKLNLDDLPSNFPKYTINNLGGEISSFINHVLNERIKSESLNWCFSNIKRIKIFLQIFHANETGTEVYKEEIAKRLTEYSYKTIAKIIDDGIAKGHYILLAPVNAINKDAKVKNILPSEKLIIDFFNWSIKIMDYIDKKKL